MQQANSADVWTEDDDNIIPFGYFIYVKLILNTYLYAVCAYSAHVVLVCARTPALGAVNPQFLEVLRILPPRKDCQSGNFCVNLSRTGTVRHGRAYK